jgi:hypothetical protein
MVRSTPPPACSLCCADSSFLLLVVHDKRYWRCPNCELTFLGGESWLSHDEERAVYELHQNSETDPGYRGFLSKLTERLLERLEPGCEGIDYGCGPGPALASMLREAGHEVTLYDPFFAADPSALQRTYDFIVCTETAEHFQHPGEEFERLNMLLRPGGLIGLMTCFQTDDAAFERWHYRRDPTHVVFYRERTMRVLAQRHGWTCDIPVKDVAFFTKSK